MNPSTSKKDKPFFSLYLIISYAFLPLSRTRAIAISPRDQKTPKTTKHTKSPNASSNCNFKNPVERTKERKKKTRARETNISSRERYVTETAAARTWAPHQTPGVCPLSLTLLSPRVRRVAGRCSQGHARKFSPLHTAQPHSH